MKTNSNSDESSELEVFAANVCRGEKCEHDDSPCCDETASLEMGRLICTLAKEHFGPHIACGTTTHNMVIWNDKLATRKFRNPPHDE